MHLSLPLLPQQVHQQFQMFIPKGRLKVMWMAVTIINDHYQHLLFHHNLFNKIEKELQTLVVNNYMMTMVSVARINE